MDEENTRMKATIAVLPGESEVWMVRVSATNRTTAGGGLSAGSSPTAIFAWSFST
jgi:hypothetical protein